MTEPAVIHATFPVELRIPDRSERIVEGVVVPWGETSYMTPDPHGERFVAGSLTRTVTERGDRVKLFRNHHHDQAIGRAVAWQPGHEQGCWAQFRIGRGALGDEVLDEVGEGLLDAFSIGFRPIRTRRGNDGAREVAEAALHEVSLCPIGAYDGARVLAMRTPAPARWTLPQMPTVNLTPLPPLIR
jgi:HK97 family phage prohead protease